MTMRYVDHKVYHFTQDRHWRAGVSDQFEIRDGRLLTAAKIELSPLPRTSVNDNTPALSVDPCGDIFWVRKDFQLIRSLSSGPMELGSLAVDSDQWQPVELVMTYQQIWLLIKKEKIRLMRYANRNLQRLAPPKIQAEILAICSDGNDGVWAIYQGETTTELAHINPSGEVAETIELVANIIDVKIAIDHSHKRLIILDRKPQVGSCDTELAWRLWQVNIGTQETTMLFELPQQNRSCQREIPDFQARHLTIDSENRISLTGPLHLNQSEHQKAHDWPVWTLSMEGEVQAQIPNVFAKRWLPVEAMAAGEALIITGTRGVAKLCRQEIAQRSQPDRIATFITPTLISPEGVHSGWMRADIDIDMEAGVAVEVSIATSRDQTLIDEADALFSNTELPARFRLRRLQALLPWNDQYTKVFQAAMTPADALLRFPLQDIKDTHVWLQIQVHPAPGFKAPAIKSLRVLYPDVSYQRYLPAIYQKNASTRQFLRRLLVIFESTFGDFDAVLTGMPNNIDPATAPVHWLPFLLSWLGLPPATELNAEKQRELLLLAPALLRYRGTLMALEKFLQFLVGEHFAISDSGLSPAPWMLTRPNCDYAPRLGSDTLLLSQRQPAFRLGQTPLGETALGFHEVDAITLFARRKALIILRIAVSHARKEKIKPLVERYIPFLIPAHCRFRLKFVSKSQLQQQQVFDQDLRVEKETLPQLGIDTPAGNFYLPTQVQTQDDTYLGPTSYLDDLYL